MGITVASTHKTAKVNYPNLDLMKFFLALLVVEIHTRPLKCFYFAETLIEGIDVLAVPLFFSRPAFFVFEILTMHPLALLFPLALNASAIPLLNYCACI